MHRLILSLGCAFTLTACNKVPDACLELQDELSFPYGFATYEAAGRSHDEWRTDLRRELVDAITFLQAPRIPDPPVLIGESLIDGTRVFEFESEVDGVPIPYGVLMPQRAVGQPEQHVVALFDGLDHVMSSGHFLPYGCINTDFAHAGQDILAMEGVAEIYDVTGMVAPKGQVDLFFGAQDTLFTSASVESFERLEVIFDKLGSPGEANIHVNPSIGHEVDPDAVIAALPVLPGG